MCAWCLLIPASGLLLWARFGPVGLLCVCAVVARVFFALTQSAGRVRGEKLLRSRLPSLPLFLSFVQGYARHGRRDSAGLVPGQGPYSRRGNHDPKITQTGLTT